jgi:hypothetical protein
MTLGEKIEQAVTGRPDSHVPARVLQRLTGLPERPGTQPLPVWAMDYGQAALLGALRSVMSQAGLRGPVAPPSSPSSASPTTRSWRTRPASVRHRPPWPRKELVA